MGKGLGIVALETLCARIIFLRQKAQRRADAQETLEEFPRLIMAAHQDIIVHEPERTGQERALPVRQGIARILLEHGHPVPVFVSANVPEGDDRNRELIARFADRVRPIEP